MKKLLVILALGAFAACNSGENKETVADTTATKVDSTVVAPVDSTTVAADTSAAKM